MRLKRLLAPTFVFVTLAIGTAAFTQSFPDTLGVNKGPNQPINTGTAAFTQSIMALLGMNKGPKQPITFSHKLHAGTLKMDCLYCHYSADKSPVANIPPAATCMGCHRAAATDRPEVVRLTKMFNEGTLPEWVEVYRLPDHVKFNHKRHVKAGLECKDCHGPVPEMDVMYQYPSLKMGWCLKCHRDNLNHKQFPASMDCLVCHH